MSHLYCQCNECKKEKPGYQSPVLSIQEILAKLNSAREYIAELESQLAELREENGRLRAKLEEILQWDEAMYVSIPKIEQDIIRQALGGGK